MSFLNLFPSKVVQITTTEPPKPVELCSACSNELVMIKQKDGVYCQECGELLSLYTASADIPDRHRYRYHPSLPQRYEFTCTRCFCHELSSPDRNPKGQETILECWHCDAELHAPAGFCVCCWSKLANNGRCINSDCKRYHKPEEARFIPIYEVRVPSPHCSSCGQPFIVFNKEVGNRKIAEIALGPGGYEWISEQKGCRTCGHSFEKPKK